MDIFEKIREMIEMMKEFDLSEIEVKDGEKEVRLRRGMNGLPGGFLSQIPSIAWGGGIPAQIQSPSSPTGDPAAAAKDPNLIEFKSPMVGTFYRAPSPESPPYVTEGDRVNSDTILCIVEAMKVMNEIKAEVTGEVAQILVENGEAVEFGQPLFLIRRAG